MALIDAEQLQIKHWLTSRFPGGLVCPLCRGDMWETNKAEGLIASGPPIFLASCKHCGHILLFSPALIKAPIAEPRFAAAPTESHSDLATLDSVRPLASTQPLKATPSESIVVGSATASGLASTDFQNATPGLDGGSPAATPVNHGSTTAAVSAKAGRHV